jgi:hypothetical protein
MAARENQGYLIAVIILVLLTLVLALAAFLGLSKAGENATLKLAAEHKLELSKTLSDAYQSKARILEALVGDFGPSVAEVETDLQTLNGLAANPKLEAIEQGQVQEIYDRVNEIYVEYKKDMLGSNTTEEGAPVQEQTWRSRIQSLTALVAKQVNDNKIASNQTKLAEAEAASKIEDAKNQLAINQKSLNDLNDKLAADKKFFSDNQDELQSKLDEAVAGNNAVNKSYQDFQDQSSTAMSKIQNEIAKVEAANEGLKTRINLYEREVFDRPDGQIVKVASRLKSVFIDIGSEDGLPDNETFSIYDQDVLDFDKGQQKAKIEVTRIYPFRAEARITEEDPTNPILAGDHILTATWDPGVAVPFAVVGTFDLDGDQFDDRAKLIQMIERNGGKVVATHDDEGNIKGKIDYTVRYIVIGDPPSLVEDAKAGVVRNASAIQSTMRSMTKIAEENTVDKLDLQKLLNKMGVRAKPKTQQIQRGIRRFPTRQPSDAATDGSNN